MLTVAITGGIGSGKSTVTDYLLSRGFTVIDADKMSRELTSAGGRAIPYIREHFGDSFIAEDGSLDRVKMRDLVFRDPDARALLEAGTTQVVIEDINKIMEEKASHGDSVIFFDIPLLFEKHQEGNYDQIWVITADYNLRAERVMKRDNIEPSVIDLIMDTQEDENRKIAGADLVLYNNGTVEELLDSVDDALNYFEL